MIYLYPKFSKYELPGVRFVGSGLGNLLFVWARAIVCAEKYNFELVWPTWPSIKLGPWIRWEKDKRFYGDLFKSRTCKYCGFKKYMMLLFKKKVFITDGEAIDVNTLPQDCLIIYKGYDFGPKGFQMNFEGIKEYRDVIYKNITENLKSHGRKALSFDASQAINVHVRLGDFTTNTTALNAGKNNMRISVKWYADVIRSIRDVVGRDVPVNIFSDGTDQELKELLDMQNVKRVFFGNSVADIIALSKAPVMISSGSSFSLWARYLGQCSSISYTNQMKDRVLLDGSNGFEFENNGTDPFDEPIRKKLVDLYGK